MSLFDSYAKINVPNAWKKCTGGQHFPVAYLKTEEVERLLGIRFEELEWQPSGNSLSANSVENEPEPVSGSRDITSQGDDVLEVSDPSGNFTTIRPYNFSQARQALSLYYRVPPDQIRIRIEG